MAQATYGYGRVGPDSAYANVKPNEHLGMQQNGPYRYEPPTELRANSTARPIDFLAPGTAQHAYVLRYLMDRLNWSEQKMSQFYPRWRANEQRHQAYVTLPEYDRILSSMRDNRKPPEPASIVVPYNWATQQTIVTYLLHTFGGRKPIVQVGAYRGEQVQRAKNMETLLQYNFDFKRYVYHLYNLFTNGELYGLAIQRNMWTRETRLKTVTRPPSPQLAYMSSLMGVPANENRVTERAVSFEGNDISVLSPYMFFPDPRVPMVDVADKGEFVFWRSFEGRHILLRAEASGQIKWVKYASSHEPYSPQFGGDSAAGIRALGDSLTNAVNGMGDGYAVGNNMQVDQGTVEIIPAELGLSQSREPEKWLFTIINKCQIVQAEPLGANHGQHPVSVAEPNAFGHSFGQIGTADLNAPIQDLMSWMINSHIFNVRASLNNLFFVDPNRVEMDDFLDPQPGGIVRLKMTPFGNMDVRTFVQQMPVQDITRAHLQDFELIQRIGADLTGATDNMRGLQDSGGRKTATEVRTSFEAGGSRLASRAMLYGAMCITPGASQMASNFQQYLSQEMELRVLGSDGREHSVRINPEGLEGDFFFPIHDGTLPMDKVAMLDTWRQLFMGIVQDPSGMLQQQYNAPAIFRFMAKLSGAQNIDEFNVTAGNPDALAMQAQRGNMVPMSELPGLMKQMPFNQQMMAA